MAKGSGRRRITPSDGLQYDPETDMTNIEHRGGHHTQSASKELRLGLRTGAGPTAHGSSRWGHGRGGGKGRKDDNRNWKSHHKGKQYEANVKVREAQEHHRPVPEGVANRMREKSINSDVRHGGPYGIKARQKFMDKFGKKRMGERHAAYRTERSSTIFWRNKMDTYRLDPNRYKAKLAPYKIGFAKFEEKVQNILQSVRYGWVDAYGHRTYSW